VDGEILASETKVTTVEFLISAEFWLQMIASGAALIMALIAFAWTRQGSKH
jgi:hypothetical protein